MIAALIDEAQATDALFILLALAGGLAAWYGAKAMTELRDAYESVVDRERREFDARQAARVGSEP